MTISCKHTLLLAGLLLIIGSITVSAASFDTELHHQILNTTESSGPMVSNDIIMMSYSAAAGTQVVSLALEHENYRMFHTFEKNRHGVFVLTMPVPEGMTEIRYRIVVDGLWTVDPNTEIARDSRGVLVSSLTIPVDSSTPQPGIKQMSDGSTRFVYMGDAGSSVSLVGDFNRWDPYLTPMKESPVHPGVYSITMAIPSDFRYYRYVVNGEEIADPDNFRSSRNGWGEVVSIIR